MHHVAAYLYFKNTSIELSYKSESESLRRALGFLIEKHGYQNTKDGDRAFNKNNELENDLGKSLKPIFKEVISSYIKQSNKENKFNLVNLFFKSSKDSKHTDIALASKFLKKLNKSSNDMQALTHIVTNINTLGEILPSSYKEQIMNKAVASTSILLACNILQFKTSHLISENGFKQLSTGLMDVLHKKSHVESSYAEEMKHIL